MTIDQCSGKRLLHRIEKKPHTGKASDPFRIHGRGQRTHPGIHQLAKRDYIRRAPLKRTGWPDEVAESLLYLINLQFTTGQVLVLDGALTL